MKKLTLNLPWALLLVAVAATSLTSSYAQFATPTRIGVSGSIGPHCAIPVDVDNDGLADVVSVAATPAELIWYKNLGGGQFGNRTVIGSNLRGLRLVRSFDADQDGYLDLVVNCLEDSTVCVYYNQRGGTFSRKNVIGRYMARPVGLEVEDINNDGRIDVLGTSLGNGGLTGGSYWFKNNGNRDFDTATYFIDGRGTSPHDIKFVDVTGDSIKDIVTPNFDAGSLDTYKGLGNGSFGPKVNILPGGFTQGAVFVSTADFNSDGRKELAVSSFSTGNTVQIVSVSDSGTYTTNPLLNVNLTVRMTAIVDYDNNGTPDILTATEDGLMLLIPSNGNGTFNPVRVIGTNMSGMRWIEGADMDGDGDKDLLVAAYESNNLFYFENLLSGSSKVRGRYFVDRNANCTFDSSDISMANKQLRLLPSNAIVNTDNEGYYDINLKPGQYRLAPIEDESYRQYLFTPCSPSVINIFRNTPDTSVNLGVNGRNCFQLDVKIAQNRKRRCFINYTKVVVSNSGLLASQPTSVLFKLPQLAVPVFQSYSYDSDSNIVLPVPAIAALSQYETVVYDSVRCLRGITGTFTCTEATLVADTGCATGVVSQYDGSNLVALGRCFGRGDIQYVVKNTGSSMLDSTRFMIYYYDSLQVVGKVKIAAGDSLAWIVPDNGDIWRLDVEQALYHPYSAFTAASITGCALLSIGGSRNTFSNTLPLDEDSPKKDVDCKPIIDSFDPNDKAVLPKGIGAQNYVATNRALEYTIRFENMGSDTAFTVVVDDSLSKHLDLATLGMGALSHKGTVNLSTGPSGNTLMRITFRKINLPHRAVDPVGSNGFINFRIKPKANLPLKTVITNQAGIVFDYNDPVITNITSVTVFDTTLTAVVPPTPPVPVAAKQRINSLAVSIFPNPTSGSITIAGEKASLVGATYTIADMAGKTKLGGRVLVSSQTVKLGLSSGIYIIRVSKEGKVFRERIVIR